MIAPDQLDLPELPRRAAESHKGHFGLVLIVGGSRGMAGAVALAGMAALRGGAGLVRLAVPDPCLETVAGFDPAYMTVPLPADAEGRISEQSRVSLEEQLATATVVACGPGLGRSPQLDSLLAWLYQSAVQPMVVDADALNALAGQDAVLRSRGGPRILTPHPGEFVRLSGRKVADYDSPQDAARSLSEQTGAVVVLKGHQTCIAEGTRVAVNTTGNPGMATGGSGDVLTGLIAALAAQGLDSFDAARLGVHLHGLSGDLAAERLGQESLTAGDLVAHLSRAFLCNRGE